MLHSCLFLVTLLVFVTLNFCLLFFKPIFTLYTVLRTCVCVCVTGVCETILKTVHVKTHTPPFENFVSDRVNISNISKVTRKLIIKKQIIR